MRTRICWSSPGEPTSAKRRKAENNYDRGRGVAMAYGRTFTSSSRKKDKKYCRRQARVRDALAMGSVFIVPRVNNR